jgi:hypothetical protein
MIARMISSKVAFGLALVCISVGYHFGYFISTLFLVQTFIALAFGSTIGLVISLVIILVAKAGALLFKISFEKISLTLSIAMSLSLVISAMVNNTPRRRLERFFHDLPDRVMDVQVRGNSFNTFFWAARFKAPPDEILRMTEREGWTLISENALASEHRFDYFLGPELYPNPGFGKLYEFETKDYYTQAFIPYDQDYVLVLIGKNHDASEPP